MNYQSLFRLTLNMEHACRVVDGREYLYSFIRIIDDCLHVKLSDFIKLFINVICPVLQACE